ncbi:NAD(P)-dependent oxidoreductase [Arcobacteraceae bacterium]|nr:NAD(P)-dependent oxidoreductase [Arcobacteraceae bacterium]
MQNNNTIPILLKNPKILIIGGGNVALQKATALRENNIEFHIISEVLSNKIIQTTSHIQQKRFKTKDLKDFFIIIDATGVESVAKKLLKYKKKNSILLNIVNNPKNCDFYFMALTKNIPLQIAVSSNGASPTAAKFFRDECEKIIPKDISKYLIKKQKQRAKGIIKKEKTHKELKRNKRVVL